MTTAIYLVARYKLGSGRGASCPLFALTKGVRKALVLWESKKMLNLSSLYLNKNAVMNGEK